MPIVNGRLDRNRSNAAAADGDDLEATGRTGGNAFRRPARPDVCVLRARVCGWYTRQMGIHTAAVDVPVEGDDIKKVQDGSSGRAYCTARPR